ncbi:MAG TPA: hypothetical protein VER96_39020 [Polyangiaceae bacterium]|nr:hypothetical protein [Polyangiaceae bacterium]
MILSESVLLQVSDELVHGRLAQGVKLNGHPELAQCTTDMLVFGAEHFDVVAMRGPHDRKQEALLRIEVISKLLLELSPLFTQRRRVGSFDCACQLRQEFLERAVIAQ